jgi:hypothetical protein
LTHLRDSWRRWFQAQKSQLGSFAVIGASIAAMAVAFVAVAGWLSPNRLTPARTVDALGARGGDPVGHRRNHAKGICFTGEFVANVEGERLSAAPMLAAGRYPVIGRFAIATGNPDAADATGRVRSLQSASPRRAVGMAQRHERFPAPLRRESADRLGDALGRRLSSGYPIVLYGSTHLPPLVSHDDRLHALLHGAYVDLAFVFFAVILLHIAASLFHVLIRRDGVFASVAPRLDAAGSKARPAPRKPLTRRPASGASAARGGFDRDGVADGERLLERLAERAIPPRLCRVLIAAR